MNDLLCSEEKQGGLAHPPWSFQGFQNFVDDCGLVDLGFSGYPFTWRNNRSGEGYIQEQLDRVLATPSWCLLFDQASVTHLNTVGSDHNALLLNLRVVANRNRVPFRLDARWVEDDEAYQVISQAWSTQVQDLHIEEIVEAIPHKITDSMNQRLTRPVTDSEIHTALMGMGLTTALGIDDMTPLFYQSYWSIVGADVVAAVKRFFHSSHLLRSVNQTLITLIPKWIVMDFNGCAGSGWW
ncbi:hypothetical protein Vadar_019280 [Vaccinium darrowii]|uniref:Uncharacterized protein n=1 Tax=Vaccinium darrowii TaxID=229202 RepID=A0ACB7X1W9_9ERIC|nr:hypothetical protein Vadar_019280 [Vaccinium darrowii]